MRGIRCTKCERLCSRCRCCLKHSPRSPVECRVVMSAMWYVFCLLSLQTLNTIGKEAQATCRRTPRPTRPATLIWDYTKITWKSVKMRAVKYLEYRESPAAQLLSRCSSPMELNSTVVSLLPFPINHAQLWSLPTSVSLTRRACISSLFGNDEHKSETSLDPQVNWRQFRSREFTRVSRELTNSPSTKEKTRLDPMERWNHLSCKRFTFNDRLFAKVNRCSFFLAMKKSWQLPERHVIVKSVNFSKLFL